MNMYLMLNMSNDQPVYIIKIPVLFNEEFENLIGIGKAYLYVRVVFSGIIYWQ